MQAAIVYLGVGASVPVQGRGLSSVALVYKGDIYLFDAGEGTQERLLEAGLSPLRVKAIFVTHLHGDHFFGLPGLLQMMTLHDRRSPLQIVGPLGLRDYILAAESVTGHVRSYDIVYSRAREGVVYEDDNVVVRSFRVCHGSIEAYGYVVEEKPRPGRLRIEKILSLGLKPGPYLARLKRGERVEVEGIVLEPSEFLEEPKPGFKIVYTGDTRPCVTTVRASRNADILIHDATFLARDAPEAREKGHSTAREAALVARAAKARCLALIHFSARYRDTTPLVREARRLVSCVYAAEPLMMHVLRV